MARRIGLQRVLETAGVPLDAFHDLATARMARFNEEVSDVRPLAYASVVGVVLNQQRPVSQNGRYQTQLAVWRS